MSQPRHDSAAPFQSPPQGYRHLAVLLVGDREATETLRCALDQMRIYAVVTHDGETALKIARAMCFNLVILDILLPGLNGFETCQALRNLPAMRDVPVLFVNCVITVEVQTQAAALRAMHYFYRPFGLPEFQAQVECILSAEAQRQLSAPGSGLQSSVRRGLTAAQGLRHQPV